MTVPRLRWHELPSTARDEVERRTGPILEAFPVETGSISEVVAMLEISHGRILCKGASAENPMGWMHRNKARINPYLLAQMLRLRWQVDAEGWLLLGFDYVKGRHPDLTPGSPDLPAVAAALSTMSATLTPCPAPRIQPAVVRWASRIAPEVVDGDAHSHRRDAVQFLLRQSGVTVVDWSMPCRGAAWIATALMVVRLIRAGHSPEQAER